jgi:hypothetical protein
VRPAADRARPEVCLRQHVCIRPISIEFAAQWGRGAEQPFPRTINPRTMSKKSGPRKRRMVRRQSGGKGSGEEQDSQVKSRSGLLTWCCSPKVLRNSWRASLERPA